MNPKILGIAGSIREGSYTQIVLRLILEALKKRDLDVEELSLNSLKLPFFLGTQEEKTLDSVRLFKNTIARASAVILATPEYHGSISGILKNALDFLEDELSNKIVGVVAVMGGNYGGASVEHAKTVMHKLKAWVIPHDLIIQRSSLILSPEGKVNTDIEKRVHDFALHFSKACLSFHPQPYSLKNSKKA